MNQGIEASPMLEQSRHSSLGRLYLERQTFVGVKRIREEILSVRCYTVNTHEPSYRPRSGFEN